MEKPLIKLTHEGMESLVTDKEAAQALITFRGKHGDTWGLESVVLEDQKIVITLMNLSK